MQHWRFFLRTPMFFHYQSRGARPRIPGRLHPWVRAAHARTRAYRANPNPPRVRAIEQNEIRDIADCEKKKLEYGDVVGLVFSIIFAESPTNWGPVYLVTDVIRVMHANRSAYPLPDDDEGVEDTPEQRFSLTANIPGM